MPSKVPAYQAKRDFKKTGEPSGDVEVRLSKRLRFVIQKHDATRLHYDLRLELDGVFKSWAVTRGPSLDTADKRLAVEVEDHPLDYGDFEGTIPKGEYGGGTVMLWDRGYWEPEGDISPEAAMKKGDLKFVLHGDRLKGSFVLVRMKKDRDGGKRTNWLLIKHRDDHAVSSSGGAILNREKTSVASGRDMAAITSGKGRKPKPFMLSEAAVDADAVWDSSIGFAAEERSDRKLPASNPDRRASKASMPAFIPPQLCKSQDRPPSVASWLHEIKFDGYRIQMRIEAGRVQLKTRKGLDWTKRFSAIAKDAQVLPDAIIDGEICALDDSGAPDFAALQAALSEGRTDDLVYFAFDFLFADSEDLRDMRLDERKSRLDALLADAKPGPRVRFVEHFETGGDAVLRSACRLSLEGIVSKKVDAPYRSGRSDSWIKSKCRAGHEVVIGGYTTNGSQFRSLLAGVYRGKHFVYVGRVGTGFGNGRARMLLDTLKPLKTARSPSEVTAGEPAPQARATPIAERNGKATTKVYGRKSAKAEVMGVLISNPDKPLWPDEDPPVTKQNLALYYEAIGAWMIDHLRGRPCSVVRAPGGIDKEQFFQRHAMTGTSNLLELVEVPGDKKPYLQVDRVEGLAALAQVAAVELHPWNCQPGKPDVPGRLVFDLDPGADVAFSMVVDTARELRDRLDDLGLVSFCKTTGGKGLHVVTPLDAGRGKSVGWEEAKDFAYRVCQQMAEDQPDLYLTKMAKKLRKGRIFLDYLRNDRMATAVAPLSARARPGATVSMPLTWVQVKSDLDPKRFTILTVPTILSKSDAWKDYDQSKRSLAQAIKRLDGKA